MRGTRALQAHDPRGLVQAADDIAHDLKTDPVDVDPLPLRHAARRDQPLQAGRAAHQELHDQRHRHGHDGVGAGQAARGLRPPRASVQRLRHARTATSRSSGRGQDRASWWTSPSTRAGRGRAGPSASPTRRPISWLNTRVDRACVDVNEFGWVCGWVMECMEKGYLTEKQVGFRLRFGDWEGAYRLLQMITHREGFGDILAEGVKRASEKVGGQAAECAIYTMKGACPRGHDHRGRWEEMLDTCTSSNGTMESANPTLQTEVGAPGRINPFDGEQVAGSSAASRAGGTSRTRWAAARSRSAPGWRTWRGRCPPPRAGTTRCADAVRFGRADGRHPARVQPALRHRDRRGVPVQALRLAAGGRPGQGPQRDGAVGAHARHLVRDGRATTARPASRRKKPCRPSASTGSPRSYGAETELWRAASRRRGRAKHRSDWRSTSGAKRHVQSRGYSSPSRSRSPPG